MADKPKCPFCGSETIRVKSPYLNRHGEPIYDFCCQAQKKNNEYIGEHFDPRSEFQINENDVSKL